jgi:hypothetical protein
MLALKSPVMTTGSSPAFSWIAFSMFWAPRYLTSSLPWQHGSMAFLSSFEQISGAELDDFMEISMGISMGIYRDKFSNNGGT